MLATTWRSSMPGARPTSLLGRSTRSGGHATPGRGTDPRSWRCSRSPKPPHESSRDNNLDSYRPKFEYEYEYEYDLKIDGEAGVFAAGLLGLVVGFRRGTDVDV